MEKLRVSSYVISVKLDNEDDKYILLHGYTGAVDIIDNRMKEYFFSGKNLTEGLSTYSKEVVVRLKERGYLTTKSKEEEFVFVKKTAEVLHKRNKQLNKSFTLLVTYDCNFRCPYCFEREIIKESNNNHQRSISKPMVDNFFSKILEIESNEKLHHKYIDLFGGEPLLKENRSIIEYCVEKGKTLGYAFTATTNGYDLNYFEDYLEEGCIESVQITIDGSQVVHDTRRVHFDHTNSFDQIINNVKTALNKGIYVKVRVNIDENNINELVKLDKEFEILGLYSYPKFLAYAAFISGELNFIPNDIECENLKEKKSMTKVTQKDFLDIFKQNSLRIKHNTQLQANLHRAICEGKALKLSPVHCTAQGNSYVFDPFGNIYSCLEVVGNKEKAIGSYIKDVKWYAEKDKWFNRNVGNIVKCSKCKYALLCGGGCFTKTFSNSKNSLVESYCDSFSLVIQNVVNEAYAQYKKSTV